ncbi:MAG: hypothetical protein ACK553_10925 [Planctomycetota bacterium]|jgi:hypothetical protein
MTFEVFPQLLRFETKKGFQGMRQIAVARLPDDVRGELVARLEAGVNLVSNCSNLFHLSQCPKNLLYTPTK